MDNAVKLVSLQRQNARWTVYLGNLEALTA